MMLCAPVRLEPAQGHTVGANDKQVSTSTMAPSVPLPAKAARRIDRYRKTWLSLAKGESYFSSRLPGALVIDSTA